MKEIGGYFQFEELIKNEYYKDLIALNSARNALLYILKARNIKTLYLPFYLCDSIKDMLTRYNYTFEFYNIDIDFLPIFEKELLTDEYIYIVNYFGFHEQEKITFLKEKYQNIILDNTQAFFQTPLPDVDTIYCLRKFFGVPDGSYLSTNSLLTENLEIDSSKDRMRHLLGRYEGKASDYYKDFIENEDNFKKVPLRKMSKLTHNILGAIDYKNICKIRNHNYNYLKEKLDKFNKIETKDINGPFAYPFYIENALEIKKELSKMKIYVPTLWPNVIEDMPANSVEYNYSANILPLPCDQRYDLEDMELIFNRIKTYL